MTPSLVPLRPRTITFRWHIYQYHSILSFNTPWTSNHTSHTPFNLTRMAFHHPKVHDFGLFMANRVLPSQNRSRNFQTRGYLLENHSAPSVILHVEMLSCDSSMTNSAMTHQTCEMHAIPQIRNLRFIMSKGGASVLSVSIKASLSGRGDQRSNELVCLQLEMKTEEADTKLLWFLKKVSRNEELDVWPDCQVNTR